MADYVKIKKSLLTAIADAIRAKFALGGTYTPAQMAEAINNVVIDGDAINENRFITGTWDTYTNDTVTEIATGAFYGSGNLTSVSFPNVTMISGANAFNYCTKLTSIDFPKLEIIESTAVSAFQECTSLTSISLPELTSPRATYVFRLCRQLINVDLPKLKGVGYGMFYYCDKLTRLDFPAVVEIGTYAFYQATSLTTLILRSSTMCTLPTSSVVSSIFQYTPIASGTGYVYVPAALVDTYKADSKWSTYANQIRAIEDYPDICGS